MGSNLSIDVNKDIQKRQLFKFFVTFALSLLFLLTIPDYRSEVATQDWCRTISYYVFIMLIFQLVTLKWMMVEFRLLPLAFLFILYIFNFPQVVLYGFDLEQVDRHEGFSSVFYFNNVPESVDVALKSITGLFLGLCTILLFQSKSTNTVSNNKTYKTYKYPPIKLIFFIGFVADLICNVFVVITMGYADVDNVPYMNIVRYFSLLLPSAVVAIFADPEINSRTKKRIFIFFLTYKILCMLGGYRAFALISILLSFYVYYKICSPFKVKFKHILIAIILIQIGGGMLAGIRDTRQNGVKIDIVINSMLDINNNAILSLLSDFGVTLSIICTVLDSTNGIPINGSHLLGSFATIIPGASDIVKNSNYQNMEGELGLRNAGGSLIGDLVFDYGKDSIIVTSLILGCLYGFVFERFEKSLNNLSPFALAYLFPILVDLIFCARSTLAKMPREIVWYFILLGFMTVITPKRKKQLIRYD